MCIGLVWMQLHTNNHWINGLIFKYRLYSKRKMQTLFKWIHLFIDAHTQNNHHWLFSSFLYRGKARNSQFFNYKNNKNENFPLSTFTKFTHLFSIFLILSKHLVKHLVNKHYLIWSFESGRINAKIMNKIKSEIFSA